jgi:hypothetical protein
VIPPRLRLVTALLSAMALTAAANLPPEHGHRPRFGRAAVVHRHLYVHPIGDPSRPRLDDDDGSIVWMESAYLSGAGASQLHMNASRGTPIACVPTHPFESGAKSADSATIHSPPRTASGLRSPPVTFL